MDCDVLVTEPPTHNLQSVSDHYSSLFLTYGDTAQAGQWSSRETQDRRLRILLRSLGEESQTLKNASFLDFGCGTARLLEVLQNEVSFRGEYTGVDISQSIIDHCQVSYPQSTFLCQNILTNPLSASFDFVVCSGTFNNSEMGSQLRDWLKCLFDNCRVALVFNLLSTHVDYFEPELVYFDPSEILHFCKTELSSFVSLKHDYEIKSGVIPFEFTMVVRKTPAK